MSDPTPGAAQEPVQPNDGIWPYVGVGCLTTVAGLVGGGMLGVAIAKAVSVAQQCTNEIDPRTPCNWWNYWTWGARIGVILLPTVTIWLMRRNRKKQRNTV
jgi:hypothetical protein